MVLPKHRIAIFVHGCFWHRHFGCTKSSTPKNRVDFWQKKFAENVLRDQKAITKLQELGWHPVIVWGCETKREDLSDIVRNCLPGR